MLDNANASISANYEMNLDTGPGYFTIVDESGIDTGRRFVPGKGFSLASQSGFNYFAPAGQGDAGAVPEPASWALLLSGFGLVGGAMRRRKAIVAFAQIASFE